MPLGAVVRGESRHYEIARRSRRRSGAVPAGRGSSSSSASTVSIGQPAERLGVGLQQLQQLVRRVVVGLPRLRHQVEHDDEPGAGAARAPCPSSRSSRCGMTLVNHDPGPSTTTSASRTASTAAAQAGAPGGSRLHRHAPGRAWPRSTTCPRIVRVRAGSSGSKRSASADEVQRDAGSSAAPGRPRRPAGQRAPGRSTGSVSRSSRPVSMRLPTGCPASTPVPPRRCCSSSAQACVLGVVAGQRGQRHAQVAGRQHLELAPDAAGRAAVVGDGDDGGEVVGDAPQRRQRGVQAVPAAERDRAHGPVAATGRPVHSRPRSRCTTVVSTPIAAQPVGEFLARSPPSGACRRCSRRRGSGSACSRGV